MKHRAGAGFTLIELLIVIGIMGLFAMTLYGVPKGLATVTPQTQTRQLQAILIEVRQQAMQAGLPKKVLRSGSSLHVVDWSQAHNGWFAAVNKATEPVFSTRYSLEFERASRKNSYSSQDNTGADLPFTDRNEQSLIFWPDGTNTAGEVSLHSNDEESHYLTVSSAGVTSLR